MQAASAVQITLQRFGLWHAGLIVLGGAAVGVCAAWCWVRAEDLPAQAAAAVALCLFASLLAASSTWQRHPVVLRWDTQAWILERSDPALPPFGPAEVRVMLDAGAWLMLKVVPQPGTSPFPVQWVPLQRRGIESQWHGLRCALFSGAAASTALRPPVR